MIVPWQKQLDKLTCHCCHCNIYRNVASASFSRRGCNAGEAESWHQRPSIGGRETPPPRARGESNRRWNRDDVVFIAKSP